MGAISGVKKCRKASWLIKISLFHVSSVSHVTLNRGQAITNKEAGDHVLTATSVNTNFWLSQGSTQTSDCPTCQRKRLSATSVNTNFWLSHVSTQTSDWHKPQHKLLTVTSVITNFSLSQLLNDTNFNTNFWPSHELSQTSDCPKCQHKLLTVSSANPTGATARSFRHQTPVVWNSLTSKIRVFTYLSSFKAQLRTHLLGGADVLSTTVPT